MRRLAFAVVLLLPAAAHAQRLWQDQENTNGYCTAALLSSNCVMESVSDGGIACVPSPGAHTFLGFDGTTVVWSTVPVSSLAPGTVGQVLLTGTGPAAAWGSFSTGITNTANVVTADLSTGKTGGQSVIGGTATADSLVIKATSATPATGAKVYMQTFGGNDYYDPVTGSWALGVGGTPISLFKAGTQTIAKTGGQLAIQTNDANSVAFGTNGIPAAVIDSAQGITINSLAGGGTQCLEVNNGGKLITSGSPCGSGAGGGGGSGTVTNVAATPPIYITGTPSVTPNVTMQGAFISGSTSTTAQNLGAGVSGVEQQTVSGGVATVSQYATVPTDVQFGAASGGGLAQNSAFTFDGTTVAISTGSTTTQAMSILTAVTSPTAVTETIGSTSATGQVLEQFSTNGTQRAGFRADYVGNLYAWSTGGNLILATGGDPGAGPGTTFLTGVGSHMLAPNVAAPATPPAGSAALYVDSTSKNLCAKDDTGVINHGVRTVSLGAGQALKAVADNGTWSGLAVMTPTTGLDCSQMPVLAGDTSSAGGTCSVNVTAIENTGTMKGDLVATNVTAPGTPGAGTTAIYVDSTSKNICAKDDGGHVNHGVRTGNCGTSTWVFGYGDNGTAVCTQPSFTDVIGVLACGQIPSAGTCTPTTVAGSSGSYINSITRDAKGWVTAVGTTTTPLEVSFHWDIRGSGLNLNYNQSDVLVLVSGSWLDLVASPGINVASTLAANYGSSSSSPPTYPLSVAYGQVRCGIDVGSVTLSGTGSATLVFALYSVDTNPSNPSNWHGHGVASTSTASVPSFQTMGFVSGPPAIAANSSITPVFYRTDSNNLATITNLYAQVVCTVGQ